MHWLHQLCVTIATGSQSIRLQYTLLKQTSSSRYT